MDIASVKLLAVALIFVGSSLAAAFALAIVGSKYIESVARQPELIPTIRSQFFLVIGLVDAVPMISLVFGILYALNVF